MREHILLALIPVMFLGLFVGSSIANDDLARQACIQYFTSLTSSNPESNAITVDVKPVQMNQKSRKCEQGKPDHSNSDKSNFGKRPISERNCDKNRVRANDRECINKSRNCDSAKNRSCSGKKQACLEGKNCIRKDNKPRAESGKCDIRTRTMQNNKDRNCSRESKTKDSIQCGQFNNHFSWNKGLNQNSGFNKNNNFDNKAKNKFYSGMVRTRSKDQTRARINYSSGNKFGDCNRIYSTQNNRNNGNRFRKFNSQNLMQFGQYQNNCFWQNGSSWNNYFNNYLAENRAEILVNSNSSRKLYGNRKCR